LGPLTVTTADGEIVIAAGKQRTVLATLALSVGRPVRVSELIDGLWGDDPPATAVKTIQTYVARLRHLLPDGWIDSIPGGYAMAVDPAAVDAWRFEHAVADGRDALRAFDYETAVARLEEGLSLWRGEPVDLGDQSRGVAAAARLRELRLGTEEDLAEAKLALGAGAELVADLESAVQDQALRERRWGQLMVALYRGGRQADALRAYQRARAALVDGLGIEPGPELRAIERAVIDRSPTLLASGGGDRRRERLPPAAIPPGLAAITTQPIVGRTAELGIIAERWRQVVDSNRRVVVAHGEPGIGKTRLVGEAALLAHREGALVLFGRCEPEALTPYQAVVDALRPFLRTLPPASLTAIPGWEITELARLVPELGDRLGREPGPIVDEPGARHRLFESVASFLGRQADARPVVLVVDDLQWIDRGGAALLRQLVRSLPAQLMVLATHRSGEPESDARLAELAAQLPPDADLELVLVGSLDEDAVHELTGGDRDDAVAVRAATGGSPLFVTELLRFRAATGRLPGHGDVPSGIRQAIAGRVGRLGVASRRLAEAAAVAGDGAVTAELASAIAMTERDAIDAVDHSIAAHVLCERPDAPGAVSFTHDLVRATILGDLSATRRAHLHRRLAAAIVETTGDRDGARAAEVAHHLAAAAGGDTDPEVARWATAAAHHALSKLAWETAITQLELALTHLPSGDATQRMTLLAELGHASRATGHETNAKQHYTDAISIAWTAGATEDVGRIVLAWTEIPVDVRRELDEVIAVLRQTLDGLPASDSPLRAQLMARLAYSMAWAREPAARATADGAVAMARRTGDPVALARALTFSTSSRDQFEAFDPAGCAGELRGLLDTLDDPVPVAQALTAWFIGCVQRGDREAADEALHRWRTVADEHHLVEAGFRASVAGAHLALGDGHVALAERSAGELLDTAARSELRNLFLFAGALFYDVRRAQDRLAELLPWFESVHASGERLARVPAMRAQALAAAGRADDAAAALTDLVADIGTSITPAERPHSIVTLAEVAAELGDAAAARALRPEMERWFGLIVYDGVNGPLEPVDDFVSRLDGLLTPAAR
jgi:DNA-binding SARP family transcriptional activator